MNSWPTLRTWFEFSGPLALEVLILFAVAKLISLRLRSPAWQRCLWQMALVAMLLVLMGELNGVRGLIRWPEKPRTTVPAKSNHAVIVTIKDAEALNERKTSAVVHAPQPTIWPAVIWGGLTALFLSRALLAQLLTLSFRRTSRHSTDAALTSRVRALAGLVGLRRRVGLAVRAQTGAPFTFGVWHPLIVLPKATNCRSPFGPRSSRCRCSSIANPAR